MKYKLKGGDVKKLFKITGILFCALFLTSAAAITKETTEYINVDDQSVVIGEPLQDEVAFSWYEVSATTAKFSVTFATGASTPNEDEGILEFDSENDLMFLYDENADGKFILGEAHQVGVEGSSLNYIGEDQSFAGGEVYRTFTYELTGLEENTNYSGFGLYYNTDGSLVSQVPYQDDYVLYDPSKVVESEEESDSDFDADGYRDAIHTTIFDSNASINFLSTLRSDDAIITAIIIIGAIVLIILLIIFIIWWVIWWRRHMSLSLYFDTSKSIDENELVINLLHVNKHPRFWHAHEEDLILFAAGRPVDAIFSKCPEIRGGYRVFITEDTGNKKSMLSIMSATKYNKWYLGVRGHHETKHVFAISDHVASRIIKIISATQAQVNEETREQLLNEIVDKNDKKFAKIKQQRTGIISHISDKYSTSTSLRYQVMYPEHHILYNSFEHDDNSHDDPQKKYFYYIYNGKAYELEFKFVRKYGHLYEYDLINLQPGTLYPGLSLSFDGGETIAPSSALYGITKDENGIFPTKEHAKLAKPKARTKAHELWTVEEAEEYLGRDILHRTFDILTVGHYNDENPGKALNPDRAADYYDEYVDRWFEQTDGRYDVSPDWDQSEIIPTNEVPIEMYSSAEKLAGRAFSPKLKLTDEEMKARREKLKIKSQKAKADKKSKLSEVAKKAANSSQKK